MAGWLITLRGRDIEVFRHYARQGIYGTILGKPTAALPLRPENVYTLADYAVMRPGDLVFFFTDRHIYGVGRLVDVAHGEAVFCNWAASDDFRPEPADPGAFLWKAVSPNLDPEAYRAIRWLCCFKPAPEFLTHGVDMDYALGSDTGNVLRHLRVLSGRSFFKIEDDECDVLVRALLRRNEGVASLPGLNEADWAPGSHDALRAALGADHLLDPRRTLRTGYDRGSSLEGPVQVWIGHHLARGSLAPYFTEWAYLGNLEVASPLKPREYMDEIDVFGYSQRVRTFGDRQVTYIDQYKLIEVKGNEPTEDVVRQAMKYVDWLAHERAGGDYSLLRAFVVVRGTGLDPALADVVDALRRRRYVEPVRPYASNDWAALSVVTYEPHPMDAQRVDLQLLEVLAPS